MQFHAIPLNTIEYHQIPCNIYIWFCSTIYSAQTSDENTSSSVHHFFFQIGSPFSIFTGFLRITGGDGEGAEGGGVEVGGVQHQDEGQADRLVHEDQPQRRGENLQRICFPLPL